MNTSTTKFIEKRRDRAIAVLLGLKERELDQYLPSHVSQKYRKAILDTINDLVSAMTDVADTEQGTVVMNELYLEKMNGKLDELLVRVGNGG